MDERMKELIAIGASAAVNCHPCMQYHLSECDRLGIGRDESRAAAEVGMAVAKGAAAKTRTYLDTLLGAAAETRSDRGCGCV